MSSLRLVNTAVLVEVPATATDPTERTVLETVKCSHVYGPVSGLYAVQKQITERAEHASLAQRKLLYIQPPEGQVTTDQRVRVKGKEYRIRDITAWPDEAPRFLELLIEAEGI